MNNFPFKLLGGMTALFIFAFIGVHYIFNIALDVFEINLSTADYVIFSFLISTICFGFVSLYAVLPLKGAVKYLNTLLNQPKTENIRVSGEAGFLESFRYAEWGELGDLVQDLERKLRRRTKALLRETTELSAVMNSLGAPIVSINSQMEVAFFNSSFAVLFNLSDEDLDQGRRTRKIKDFIKESRIVDTLEEALKNENFEKKMIGFVLEDKEQIFSISMSPLRRGDDDSIYGLVASFSDETAKVELDRKRMDFVANASHELRTPIAAVSTSVSLLDKVDDAETKEQVMDSLRLNSERLVSLAQDLLDLSKLEDEAEQFEVQECNLKDLSSKVFRGMTHDKKGLIEFSYEVESGYFDESKVKQVLTNLLRNALVHTADGVKVEAKWYTSEHQELCLQVKDWGTGVPEKERARIFERFYRVEKSRSRAHGGSGIGLSIVKHIMDLHGGDVVLASSEPDRGAAFICKFPQ